MFKSLELCFCYCAEWDNREALLPWLSERVGLSAQPFGQNVLGTQKRKEGLGSRLSGKAASTEIQQEQQADPMCNQLETTKKAVSGRRSLQETQDKAFCYWKNWINTWGPWENLEINLEKWESFTIAGLFLFSEYYAQAPCVYLGKFKHYLRWWKILNQPSLISHLVWDVPKSTASPREIKRQRY